MTYQYALPDIDEKFLPPKNWESDSFFNPETNHNIHYNFCLINDAKGTIVTLPGLSEFGEKYIETAKFFNEQGYNFYVIDWAYQGRSTRFETNPHKRHSDGYETDISDLHYLISNIIQFDYPLYMLAHSMGGNIGLRYMQKHAGIFNAASLSAAMLGIKDLKYFSNAACFILSKLTKFHDRYIPGGKDWCEDNRINLKKDIFSNDKKRDKIHNAWSKANPELKIGNTTLKWLYESLKSIQILKNHDTLHLIKTPILLAYSGNEKIITNNDIVNAAKHLPNGRVLELPNAKHEILVETDEVRNLFLNETLRLFNQ